MKHLNGRKINTGTGRFRKTSTTTLGISLAILATTQTAVAQDSVSKTGCFPGDATSPWADDSNFFGSEQEDAYVVDLTPFATSWSTTFGIAPIIKSSKTGSLFFSSLMSAQSISRLQLNNVPFPKPSYQVWSEPGFGVNNDTTLNNSPSSVSTVGLLGNQFGVAFAEFATTDGGASHNAIIGGLVNRLPTDPARLYVLRKIAAVNACNDSANYAQFGFGTVDANAYTHFRADCFNCPPNDPCELNTILNDNIFRVGMAQRDAGSLNVISNDFPGGLFDANATEWVVQNTEVTNLTPGMLPSTVTGALPILLGVNFDAEFLRGTGPGNLVSDQAHWTGTDVIDQRGSVGYSAATCATLQNSHGIAGLLARRAGLNCEDGECTDRLLIWGLDANGNPTANLVLDLPATVTDNDDGFQNLVELGLPNEFNNYQSQVAFRGGNSQVAIGKDPQGRLLVAATVDHPFTPWQLPDIEREWDVNYIAVARIDCATGSTEWTMAAYNDLEAGKDILDGPGGNAIGTLRPVTGDLSGGGPAMTSPMIDAGGNVWFIAVANLDSDPEGFTRALIRAVYSPTTFSYELELVLKFDDVFAGQNSGRNYSLTFIDLADTNSISSGAPYSQNISEAAHVGLDPATLTVGDPRALGGFVMRAEITYDYDEDGDYEECAKGTGQDQDYNVLLFIGAVDQADGCATADECDDANVCTANVCDDGECTGELRDYGDVVFDDDVNVLDVTCSLDATQAEFTADCAASNADVFPCDADGTVDSDDVDATVDAFRGIDRCCALPSGACCVGGECQDDVTGPECFAALGDYQGEGSSCNDIICPAIGACCIAASCVDGVSAQACDTQGGIFFGDGTVCMSILCDPVGGCCVQGLCEDERTVDQCDDVAGTYLGDSTTCDKSECPGGACCIAGQCQDDTLEFVCDQKGGEYQGENVLCADTECDAPPAILINEIRIDLAGTNDSEYIELIGPPGASLNGMTYIVLGDGFGGSGVIEAVVPLNGMEIQPDGFLFIGEPNNEIGTPDATGSLNFENGDNVTHLLLVGFSGLFGADLDKDDDGVLDETPWLQELDRIALIEQENPPTDTEFHYGPPTVGPDETFVPAQVFRCPDGDGGIWNIGDFVEFTDDTPGNANTQCPTSGAQGDNRVASTRKTPEEVALERDRGADEENTGNAVISLVPRGGSGNAIDADPGETVIIDAFLTSANGNVIRGTQVSLPASVGDQGGTVSHVSAEPGVDTGRSDFIFVGITSVAAAGAFDSVPAVVAAVFDENAVSPTGTVYLGEFSYQVSKDAEGLFLIGSVDQAEGVTGLVRQDGVLVPAFALAAEINVEGCIDHDVDCNGIIDESEHAGFQVCMAGPGTRVGGDCQIHDANNDVDVDLQDWQTLQSTFGPGN